MSDATTALAEALDEDCPTLRRWEIEQVVEAVVAAVRGLSPDLQAELIGGEVEHRRKLLELIDRPDKPMAFRMQDIARVVGPWTPEPAGEAS